MVPRRSNSKRHIDNAPDRQETSISNCSGFGVSSSSSLLLDMPLRSHTDQQEELAVHIISSVFSQIMTVLSDARKSAKILLFDEVRYIFVDWWLGYKTF